MFPYLIHTIAVAPQVFTPSCCVYGASMTARQLGTALELAEDGLIWRSRHQAREVWVVILPSTPWPLVWSHNRRGLIDSLHILYKTGVQTSRPVEREKKRPGIQGECRHVCVRANLAVRVHTFTLPQTHPLWADSMTCRLLDSVSPAHPYFQASSEWDRTFTGCGGFSDLCSPLATRSVVPGDESLLCQPEHGGA